MPDDTPLLPLPPTAVLLASGGDTRIMLDPASGESIYGCRPFPDPELVALGSSTASIVSEAGFAAADALRLACQAELRSHSQEQVYGAHAAQLRAELLGLCGIRAGDGVETLLAASGTDLHLLVAQWIQPQRTVMITPQETGSGVRAAVQGHHFNARAACGAEVAPGAPLGAWQGELVALEARDADGGVRAPGVIDEECVAAVESAAQAGHTVLLILTDVSKTGLIVPGIATVRKLKQRWPEQVQVLVDGCQFRLAPATLRAYLAHDFMVALTGSKFMAGPTFCGALLVPRATSARYRERALDAGARAYSCLADWPAGWRAAQCLAPAANFGLLLRWEAALTQARPFLALESAVVTDFLCGFAQALGSHLAGQRLIEAVPVALPDRSALGLAPQWDGKQTIFPLLFFAPLADGGRRPLARAETDALYRRLRQADGSGAPRIQLGQPVACGARDGVEVSALRLCVSAPMLVRACRDGQGAAVTAQALAALERVAALLRAF